MGDAVTNVIGPSYSMNLFIYFWKRGRVKKTGGGGRIENRGKERR